MKPFILFLLFIGGLSGGLFSQIACGDEQIARLQRQNKKDYDARLQQLNLQVKQYIAEHYQANTAGKTQSANYTIPVVFHVVHPVGQAYGTGTNISYLQLQSQINALNAAFGKNYPAYNGQTHPAYAQNTSIRFCLARVAQPANVSFYNGPSGTEYGVMRYADNTLSTNNMSTSGATALLGLTHPNASYFPFGNYLNIWVVSNIVTNSSGITMGYAPLPLMGAFPLDGVVMRADVLGDNTTGGNFSLGYGLQQGKVLVHELGHYFNLRHIFEGGCAGANASGSLSDACDLNGDCICDIEPCTTQNISCNVPIPNTCNANYNAGTTTLDMIESYMSYADDDCMNTFTSDQAQRMWATLNLAPRFNLWQTANLGLTGVSGPNGCNPATLFTALSFSGNCTNTPIAIINPTAGNTASSWTWTAPGSSLPSSNAPTISVTYASPGLYPVKLAVSDGTTTIRDSMLIPITSCALDPSLRYRANWMHGTYGSVNFATGLPVPNNVAISNNTIKCFENAVSMSDSLGNLLFYSNGRDLWNSNHVLVNPGAPLFGWDLNVASPNNGYNGSSVGGFISFAAPKKPGKYFIVCVPPVEIKGHATQGQYAKLSYVIYDAVTQTVSAYQSFTNPLINYVRALPNYGFSENLTAVPHCNGVDIWIVARGMNAAGTGFNFYSFLVNANGASPAGAPVISGPYALAMISQACDLKGNRAGNKLVAKGQNRNAGYLWDFDQATGQINNPVTLACSVSTPNPIGGSGIIFSPNDQYVYSTVSGSNFDNIDMIDLATNTLVKTIVPANGIIMTSSYFEVGPDNNIYMTGFSNNNGSTMAQLSNPNSTSGSTVTTFISYAAIPNSRPDGLSLLNFMEGKQPAESSPFVTPLAVSCSSYSFALSPCWKIYNSTWNFGDGSATSTASTSVHTYSTTGTYTVSLTLSYNGAPLPVFTRTISVYSLAGTSITGPTVMCNGSPYLNSYGVSQFPNATYLWSASNATIAGPNSLANITAAGGASGIATLSVLVANGGCSVTATKTITIENINVSLSATPSVACVGQSVSLSGSPAGGSYSGTSNGSLFTPATTGTYNLAYTYNSPAGCYKTAALSVSAYNCTGIETAAAPAWALLLYPNPTDGILFVQSSLPVTGYTIINMLGQQLMQGSYTAAGIETATLSHGIYFIELQNAAGEKTKLKFVKE